MSAVLLSVVEYLGRHNRKLESVSWMDAVVIGIFQILAIFPGASRSGSSIAGGILRGFDRPSAARMAFLMSAPILTAAGAYETLNIIQMPGTMEFLPYLAVGFITAGVIGWFALKWLMSFLRDHSIYLFAGYCGVVGLICLVLSLF
jgi:undecaprenyl-diphosphatase